MSFIHCLSSMLSAILTVLETELKAVRMLRSAPDIELVRASLNREEMLLAEIARVQGAETNVVPMAANFAQRAAEPRSEEKS